MSFSKYNEDQLKFWQRFIGYCYSDNLFFLAAEKIAHYSIKLNEGWPEADGYHKLGEVK